METLDEPAHFAARLSRSPRGDGTRYVAVSASLQFGPWGPEGYFQWLGGQVPVAYTDDGTIAIYDLKGTNRYRLRRYMPGVIAR